MIHLKALENTHKQNRKKHPVVLVLGGNLIHICYIDIQKYTQMF